MQGLAMLPFGHLHTRKTAASVLSTKGSRSRSSTRKWTSLLSQVVDWERPLYITRDAISNFVSLGMIVGMLALLAPLVYVAMLILVNLYLLTQLHEMAVR